MILGTSLLTTKRPTFNQLPILENFGWLQNFNCFYTTTYVFPSHLTLVELSAPVQFAIFKKKIEKDVG